MNPALVHTRDMETRPADSSRMNRSSAQQRADAVAGFDQELRRLADEGVPTPDPAWREAVAVHHRQLLATLARQFDIDHDAGTRRLSLGMRIVSFLGAAALAAAVYFLFHRFWGLLATPWQVGVLLATSLGSLLACVFIRERDASGYFTKLAALVAFACFVINVSLLGTLFNITPSDTALLPWAALALLLAYSCDLRLLLVAGIGCIAAYIAARTGTFGGMYWLGFGERPENFFPAAVVLFCLPQFIDQSRHAGFAQTWRVAGLLCLLLPMLLLANWAWGSYLPGSTRVIQHVYQIAGFVLSGAAIWLGIRRGWGEVVNTGVTFFAIFLYTRFFDWWWDAVPKYLFFALLALTAVLLLFVFGRLRRAAGQSRESRA